MSDRQLENKRIKSGAAGIRPLPEEMYFWKGLKPDETDSEWLRNRH